MSEGATKVWSKAAFVALVREGLRVGTQVGEIRGRYGERVQSAAANGHTPPKILAEMVKLVKLAQNKGDLAFIEQERLRELAIDQMIEEKLLPDPFVKDLVDQAQDGAAAEKKADTIEAGSDESMPLDEGWDKAKPATAPIDPDAAAAAANGKALEKGIGQKPPADKAKKGGGKGAVKDAADRAEKKSAEKAAQEAIKKAMDKEARKRGSGDLGAGGKPIDLGGKETAH